MKNSRVVALLYLIVATISISGCGTNKKNIHKVEKYLEDKYDEEFDFRGTINGSPIPFAKGDILTVQFECDAYPDLVITANYNSKTKKYTDNMQAIIYYDEVTSRLQDVVESAGVYDYKLEFRVPEMAVNSDNDSGYTIDKYMAESNTFKAMTVILTKDIDDEFMNDFLNQLVCNNISIHGRVAQVVSMECIPDSDLNNYTTGKNLVKAFNFKVTNGEIERAD